MVLRQRELEGVAVVEFDFVQFRSQINSDSRKCWFKQTCGWISDHVAASCLGSDVQGDDRQDAYPTAACAAPFIKTELSSNSTVGIVAASRQIGCDLCRR